MIKLELDAKGYSATTSTLTNCVTDDYSVNRIENKKFNVPKNIFIMKISPIILLVCFLFCGSLTAHEFNSEDSLKYQIKKNSVYFELFGNGTFGSVNYDRIIPLNKTFGIVLRGGISLFYTVSFLGEVNLLAGGSSHFFEGGIDVRGFTSGHVHVFRAGYRFQGKKGLLIRVAPLFVPHHKQAHFGISLGYSF